MACSEWSVARRGVEAPRDETDAVHGFGWRQAGEFEQRRHDVFQAHGLERAEAGLECEVGRGGDDERDVGGALVGFAFAEVAVVAEKFAVIGGEDDNPRAAGGAAAGGEGGDERGELCVEVFDEAEVAGLGSAKFVSFEAYAVAVAVAVGRECVPLDPIAARGSGEGGGEVFVEVGWRREEGWVRGVEGGGEKQR